MKIPHIGWLKAMNFPYFTTDAAWPGFGATVGGGSGHFALKKLSMKMDGKWTEMRFEIEIYVIT